MRIWSNGSATSPGGLTDDRARDAFWHNYRCLQTFDQLSLYFCCDGYDGGAMKEVTLEQVPVAYGSSRTADLTIKPMGPRAVQIRPYPFDEPLHISVMPRQMSPRVSEPDVAAKEAFYSAVRLPLVWKVSGS